MTTGMALLCVMEILANARGDVKEEDGRGRGRRSLEDRAFPGRAWERGNEGIDLGAWERGFGGLGGG